MRGWLLIFAVLLWAPLTAGAAERIALQALFKDKAILTIDGARRVLQSGQVSPEGVKLLSTDTQAEQAVVVVDGKPQTLKLGVVISNFKSTGKGSVTLYNETNGHFYADGAINGVAVRFMVDTGATTIAINSNVADRAGLDYKKRGRPSLAQTAAGITKAYTLTLDSVTVGGITLHNVEAGVLEGNYPSPALLGMSFLGQLDMKRQGEKMELTER